MNNHSEKFLPKSIASAKKYIFWAGGIVFLLGFPFILRLLRKTKELDFVSRSNKVITWRETAANEAVHEGKMKYQMVQASVVMFSVPEDLVFLSRVEISPDSKWIAVAGGKLPHQKVYVAPFSPKKIGKFTLIADLPNAYDIQHIVWNADSKSLAITTVESKGTDNYNIVLYQIDIKEKQPKQWAVVRSGNELRKYLLSNSNKLLSVLCAESDLSFLYIDETGEIYRVDDSKSESVFSSQNQYEITGKMLSLQKSVLTLLREKREPLFITAAVKQGEPKQKIFTGFYSVLETLSIDLNTKRESTEVFCPPLENLGCPMVGNLSRYVTDLYPVDDYFRFCVIETKKPYERKVVHVDRQSITMAKANVHYTDTLTHIHCATQDVRCVVFEIAANLTSSAGFTKRDFFEGKPHTPPLYQLAILPLDT